VNAANLNVDGETRSTSFIGNSVRVNNVEVGETVLFPSLTTTERNALSASNGMVVYNETTNKLQVYAGGSWTDLH
jgi:hypothetical protein